MRVSFPVRFARVAIEQMEFVSDDRFAVGCEA
jgi:hypothetical protein